MDNPFKGGIFYTVNGSFMWATTGSRAKRYVATSWAEHNVKEADTIAVNSLVSSCKFSCEKLFSMNKKLFW